MAMQGAGTRPPKWRLSQAAFDRFLASLDPDREVAGERYETLRRNLIQLFIWRGCGEPEDHADETINRVIRKLDEGEEIRDLVSYAHGVARHLLLEIFKAREREQAALEQLPPPVVSAPQAAEGEHGVACLRRCLNRLPQESRQLIIQYYQGDKSAKIQQRQQLAASLRITLNALRYRAFDLRQKLEGCIHRCLQQT
jgi:DNA-directed RNA polymerase specialized sigma24 family protein